MKTIPYLIILPCLVFTQVVHGQEIQPGSWDIEMSLSMGGDMPAPANQSNICLNNLDEVIKAGAGCSARTTSASGNHVSMSVSCDVRGLKMDGTASLTVAQATVDGTINLAMQMGNEQSVPTVTALHAVRVGDCRK